MVCHSITRSFRQVFTNDSNDNNDNNDNNDGNDSTNFEKKHANGHTEAWEAEEGIKLAQLKSKYLISLKEEIGRNESEIEFNKIQIDKLSNEIEQCVPKIATSEANHGVAHTIENIVKAVSTLKILEDNIITQGLFEKFPSFFKKIHNVAKTSIVDCYEKRLEKLQLELDLKRMQVNIDSLRVLVRRIEKEVADDTICERENTIAKKNLDMYRAHQAHNLHDFKYVYNNLKDVVMIEELLENYKKIVADALTI